MDLEVLIWYGVKKSVIPSEWANKAWNKINKLFLIEIII